MDKELLERVDRLLEKADKFTLVLEDLSKTMNDLLKSTRIPCRRASVEDVPKAETPTHTKWCTESSPLTASALFPRSCVRAVRDGETALAEFDSVEDAVLDLYQHGVQGQDIDVFLPNGKVVSGSGYLA